jgi:hypothetical protein
MITEYLKRFVLAIGALALAATLTGCTTTQTATSETASDDSIKTRMASCNCGQLQVTVVGPNPERISLCHCNLCQKQSGSAFLIQARFPKEQVTIKGESKAWKFPVEGKKPVPYPNCSSAGASFHFCPVCGSTVWYTADTDPARIGVKIGTFNDPTFPPPKISGFESYGHPWAMKVSDLPIQRLELGE